MTIIKHRDIRFLIGTLCGACIVTLVALGFSAAPARAQTLPNIFLPPQVTFISNGKYTGTIRLPTMTLPITGTIKYLTGNTNYLQISVTIDTVGQQITSKSWLTQLFTGTPTINEWATAVSTFPTICRKEVLSGGSYPQCSAFASGAWPRTPRGLYILDCTVTAQGKQTGLLTAVQLNIASTELVSLSEQVAINGEVTAEISHRHAVTRNNTPNAQRLQSSKHLQQQQSGRRRQQSGQQSGQRSGAGMLGHNPQHLFLGLVADAGII